MAIPNPQVAAAAGSISDQRLDIDGTTWQLNSISNESVAIYALAAQGGTNYKIGYLAERPASASFASGNAAPAITNMTLVTTLAGIDGTTKFYVDYDRAFVLFHANYATDPTSISYSGMGSIQRALDFNESLRARDWSNKVNGVVADSELSSKAYAIGGTGVTDTAGKGAAKEWATETSGNVDGTSFSAKEYAQGTQASTGGSAKDWAIKAHNTQVAGGGSSDRSALHYSTEAANTLTTFQQLYHPAASSNPSSNLTEGDLYFNTGDNKLKVYDGSNWGNATSAVEGVASITELSPNGSDQHFAFAHDVGLQIVWLNGVRLIQGTDYLSVNSNSSTANMTSGTASHIYFASNDKPASGDVLSAMGWGTVESTTVVPISGGTFTGDIIIGGDLTVNGTQVNFSTTTIKVEDTLVSVGSENTSGDAVDLGWYGTYDTSGSLDLYAGMFRDAGDGKFKLFKDLQVQPSSTVNTAGTGYAVGTLVANLEGNVTGNVTGNTSGTAATVTTAAQGSITSVGTLTSLTLSGNITVADDTSIGISDSDERIEFDGAGDISVLGAKFGVGTDAPAIKFHIADNYPDWSSKLVNTHSGGYGFVMSAGGASSTSMLIMDYNEANTLFEMKGNGTTYLKGNVGIGVASPSSWSHTGPILELKGVSPVLVLHESDGGSPQWEIGASGDTLWIDDDGATRLTIDADGCVNPRGKAGTNNTVLGAGSGSQLHASANNNTFIGSDVAAASAQTATADDNTGVGRTALYSLTSGAYNTSIGMAAGHQITTGEHNTCVGRNAGFNTNNTNSITEGDANTCIGAWSGSDLTTGTHNTFLGYNAYSSAADASNQIVISTNSLAGEDGHIRIGKGASSLYIHSPWDASPSWSGSSDKRIKSNIQDFDLGLSFIDQLTTVKFKRLHQSEWPDEIRAGFEEPDDRPDSKKNKQHFGLLAQDVKIALDKEDHSDFSMWSERENGVQALAIGDLVLPLVNAVQELSAKVTALENA